MCFGKTNNSSDNSAAAVTSVKDETAAKKQRLLFTSGESNGDEIKASQGASIRKVFGN